MMILTLRERIRDSDELLRIALRQHGEARIGNALLADAEKRKRRAEDGASDWPVTPELELLLSAAGGLSNPLLKDCERRCREAAERKCA